MGVVLALLNGSQFDEAALIVSRLPQQLMRVDTCTVLSARGVQCASTLMNSRLEVVRAADVQRTMNDGQALVHGPTVHGPTAQLHREITGISRLAVLMMLSLTSERNVRLIGNSAHRNQLYVQSYISQLAVHSRGRQTLKTAAS